MGISMKELEELQGEPYFQFRIIMRFFLIGKSSSKLVAKILVGSSGGIEEKIVRTS
jgi:hypothetical protein